MRTGTAKSEMVLQNSRKWLYANETAPLGETPVEGAAFSDRSFGMRSAFIALVLLVFAASMFATPISYTFAYGDANIVVGSQTYTSVSMTIQILGDTANLSYPWGDGVANVPFAAGDATLTIGGLGTGTFSNGGYVFINDDTVGFGTNSEYDLAYLISGSFVGYDMISNFGPLAGTPSQPDGPQWVNVATSLGSTTLQGLSGDASFSAVVEGQVPEPATALLAAPFLLALWRLRRRK